MFDELMGGLQLLEQQFVQECVFIITQRRRRKKIAKMGFENACCSSSFSGTSVSSSRWCKYLILWWSSRGFANIWYLILFLIAFIFSRVFLHLIFDSTEVLKTTWTASNWAYHSNAIMAFDYEKCMPQWGQGFSSSW